MYYVRHIRDLYCLYYVISMYFLLLLRVSNKYIHYSFNIFQLKQCAVMLTKKHVEFFSPEEASDRNRGLLSWGLCPCGLLRTVQSE